MTSQIKHLGTNDLLLFKKMIALFHNVFEMGHTQAPPDAYLQHLLDTPGFIAYAAIYEGEVAAGLTAHILPMYYTEGAELFIYDIAVLPQFQRKGLGKMLLAALNDYGRQQGIKEIFVAAHEADTHALDFYRSSGGQPEKVVHFNFAVSK